MERNFSSNNFLICYFKLNFRKIDRFNILIRQVRDIFYVRTILNFEHLVSNDSIHSKHINEIQQFEKKEKITNRFQVS